MIDYDSWKLDNNEQLEFRCEKCNENYDVSDLSDEMESVCVDCFYKEMEKADL